MDNPAYENNNGDKMEKKVAQKAEDDLWELPELKTDEKSWKGSSIIFIFNNELEVIPMHFIQPTANPTSLTNPFSGPLWVLGIIGVTTG